MRFEPTCSTVFFSLAWEVVALSAVSFFIDVVVLVFESDSSVLLVMPVIIPSDFWAEEEFFFFFTCVVSFLGMEETTVFLEGADVAGIIIAAVAVGFGADVWFVVCPLSGVDTGEVISNGLPRKNRHRHGHPQLVLNERGRPSAPDKEYWR